MVLGIVLQYFWVVCWIVHTCVHVSIFLVWLIKIMHVYTHCVCITHMCVIQSYMHTIYSISWEQESQIKTHSWSAMDHFLFICSLHSSLNRGFYNRKAQFTNPLDHVQGAAGRCSDRPDLGGGICQTPQFQRSWNPPQASLPKACMFPEHNLKFPGKDPPGSTRGLTEGVSSSPKKFKGSQFFLAFLLSHFLSLTPNPRIGHAETECLNKHRGRTFEEIKK